MATPQKSCHFRDALYFIGVCGAREWIARLVLLLVATVSIHSPHLLCSCLHQGMPTAPELQKNNQTQLDS
ncbi:unnamed protein product, partial [Musa acuminata subsp. burmannicoides]